MTVHSAMTPPDGRLIAPGDAIPEFVVRPTHQQLFMFSAATWNRHHVHYSKDAAQAEGLPDVVTHRALLGNYLAQMLVNWVGDAGRVRTIAWRVVRSAPVGTTLTCRGQVDATETREDTVDVRCTLEITDAEGLTVATGSSVLALPISL